MGVDPTITGNIGASIIGIIYFIDKIMQRRRNGNGGINGDIQEIKRQQGKMWDILDEHGKALNKGFNSIREFTNEKYGKIDISLQLLIKEITINEKHQIETNNEIKENIKDLQEKYIKQEHECIKNHAGKK